MLCLLDTNVLLRAIDRRHPDFNIVRRALIVLGRQRTQLCFVAQNLIEFWAVATRGRDANGLGMSTEWAIAQLAKIKRLFAILPETAEILPTWERLVIQHRVSGKKTHDARLVAAMYVHGVSHILTFNSADFSRYAGISVIEPQTLETAEPKVPADSP